MYFILCILKVLLTFQPKFKLQSALKTYTRNNSIPVPAPGIRLVNALKRSNPLLEHSIPRPIVQRDETGLFKQRTTRRDKR